MMNLLKNVGAWHLIFLFAVIFIFVFRSQIGQLISQINSIKKDGIKINSLPETQKAIEGNKALEKYLKESEDSPVLKVVIEDINKDLEERGMNINNSATVVPLIKFLAIEKIFVHFERSYRIIFGSQIWLLKTLNESKNVGMNAQNMQSRFSHIQKTHPEFYKEKLLDDYLRFLVDAKLIFNKANIWYLTDVGIEFLIWITRNGLPENKPY